MSRIRITPKKLKFLQAAADAGGTIRETMRGTHFTAGEVALHWQQAERLRGAGYFEKIALREYQLTDIARAALTEGTTK